MKVLHVGLHKTGSTYLQQHVFPRLEGVNYYGNGNIAQNWKRGLRPKLGHSALWSTEAALGWPYPEPEKPRISELIALSRDFDASHILVVKRAFPEWVRSVWFQTLNEGGRESFHPWYVRNKGGLELWRRVFYDLEMTTAEQGLSLKILPHEDLISNPERAVMELAEFLGGSVPKDMRLGQRSNASRYGVAVVGAYIALNAVLRGKRLRSVLTGLKMSPRTQLQHGPVGKILQRLSTGEVEIPQELAELGWIDSP